MASFEEILKERTGRATVAEAEQAVPQTGQPTTSTNQSNISQRLQEAVQREREFNFNRQTNVPSFQAAQEELRGTIRFKGDESRVPRHVRAFLAKYQRITPEGEPVPMDVSSGAPIGTRLKMGFAPDEATETEMLRRAFANTVIEPIEDGNFILRGVLDPNTGQPVDMVVDELGFTLRDMLDLGTAGVEMLGAALALRKGKIPFGKTPRKIIESLDKMPRGVTKLLAESGLAATGSQVAGGVSDVGARLSTGQPIQLGEIGERRATQFGLETTLGLGFGAGGSLARRILRRMDSPLGSRAQEVFRQDGKAAVARLEQRTGIKVDLTIGQSTGSPVALKTEIVTGKTPSGTGPVEQELNRQHEQMRSLQKWMLGDEELPSFGDTGTEAIERLRAVKQSFEDVTTNQRAKIATESTTAIRRNIDAATHGLSGEIYMSDAGNALRQHVLSQRQAFREKAGELFSLPSDPVLPTQPLRNRLNTLKDKLIKATNVVENVSPIADPITGKPITTTIEGREVVQELVPSGLQKLIRGTEKLDANTPLSELRALRTTINDAIDDGNVFPEVSTKLLKEFSNAVTETIETGVEQLGDPKLATQLAKANKFYRENIERLQQSDIAPMMLDVRQRGFLENTEVVSKALKNEGFYFRLKDILEKPIAFEGQPLVEPGQEPINMLKKVALEEIYNKATIRSGGNLVDGLKLLSEIEKLPNKVARDILGDRYISTLQAGKTLGALQGKFNIDDLDQINFESPAAIESLRALKKAEAERDKFFANSIIKRFVKDEVNADSINPGEFVERYLDIASEQELAVVMGKIGSGNLRQDIEKNTIQWIFQQASRKPTAEDIARGFGDDPTRMIGGKALGQLLQEKKKKLQLVLGNDTYDTLVDYAQVELLRETQDEMAKTVGGLIAGSLLSDITDLELKNFGRHVKYFMMAKLLTTPTTRKYLSRTSGPVDPTTAIRAFIVSGPFITDVFQEFGREDGKLFLEDLAGATGIVDLDIDRLLEQTQDTDANQNP